jgi:hypothetical protein
VIALRRQALVRALAGTAFVAALLSLGARISVPATELVIPGPWRLLEGVPILDSIVESRLAMVCVPVFGILVALACDALAERGDAVSRWVAWGGVAAALVPILPTPYPTADRPDVPAFIVAGTWRQYVQPGETLVVVPLPGTADTTALQWQIAADLGFPVAGGYFVGPYAPHDRIGVYGAYPRDTTRLLDAVSSSGELPEIGSEERRLLQEDLQFWRAGAVVIGRTAHEEPLRTVLEQLFQRPGEQVGGVWVWRAN